MPLSIAVGQASLPGAKGENQDFAAVATPEHDALRSKGVALAVADGVGKGRGGGALARDSVKGILSGWYSSPETWSGARCLKDLFDDRNRLARRDHPGAACTLTMVAVAGRELNLAHVGDSRAWLVRSGEARQISVDHVWDDPDLRSVLHRAIGLDDGIVAQLAREEVRPGDWVVLGTDGFHKSFDPAALPAFLAGGGALDDLAERLVRTARARGSDDDATVVLARIDDVGDPEASWLGDSSRLEAMDPPPLEGDEFDGFRLHRRIGSSRASNVWLADDREEERRVVLKIPLPAAVEEESQKADFLREEWLGRRISHPGVVPVLALRPGRRTRLYYAMPWTSGVPVRRILSRDGAMDAYAATRLGLDVASALRALHRQGVLHRDVKPDNILRNDAGRYLLTDLGVARVDAFDDDGAVPGTATYMAPELFEGAVAQERTEIFALGVTLYECLTRRLPYGEIEPFSRPRFGAAPPPSRWNPDIPPWLESVVMKAIEPDPEKRFQVVSELEVLLERRERVEDAVSPERFDARTRIRQWQGIALLAMVVAILEAIALLAR